MFFNNLFGRKPAQIHLTQAEMVEVDLAELEVAVINGFARKQWKTMKDSSKKKTGGSRYAEKKNLNDGTVFGNTNVTRNPDNDEFDQTMTVVTRFKEMESKDFDETEYLRIFMKYKYFQDENNMRKVMVAYLSAIRTDKIKVRKAKIGVELLKEIIQRLTLKEEITFAECFSFYFSSWNLDQRLCQEIIRVVWLSTIHQVPIMHPSRVRILQTWIEYVMKRTHAESDDGNINLNADNPKLWDVKLDNGHYGKLWNFYLGQPDEVNRSFWRTVSRNIDHLPIPRPNPKDIFPQGPLTPLDDIHVDAYFMFASAIVQLALKLMQHICDSQKVIPGNDTKLAKGCGCNTQEDAKAMQRWLRKANLIAKDGHPFWDWNYDDMHVVVGNDSYTLKPTNIQEWLKNWVTSLGDVTLHNVNSRYLTLMIVLDQAELYIDRTLEVHELLSRQMLALLACFAVTAGQLLSSYMMVYWSEEEDLI